MIKTPNNCSKQLKRDNLISVLISVVTLFSVDDMMSSSSSSSPLPTKFNVPTLFTTFNTFPDVRKPIDSNSTRTDVHMSQMIPQCGDGPGIIPFGPSLYPLLSSSEILEVDVRGDAVAECNEEGEKKDRLDVIFELIKAANKSDPRLKYDD